ncbi:uncharacterized protein BYT42DRAFT_559769 [Radiomyces spectabilis]|uniref:uncharacterized protein n=1 Tax=Radiomyces spectabilis TaxID=64574 RepID=UPI00221F65CC|nr:uncharacterized protein BYT42DRAFT_559769 [Radiomyces spectabilis]KAI8388342.1 hypothetical protein BYT42DRAFT_559769 [Radiomyces spectabilis]
MLGSLYRFSLERPVIFWSFVLGSAGPVMVWTVPKIRREYFGYKGVAALPITYPLPQGPRNPPSGYEDTA